MIVILQSLEIYFTLDPVEKEKTVPLVVLLRYDWITDGFVVFYDPNAYLLFFGNLWQIGTVSEML